MYAGREFERSVADPVRSGVDQDAVHSKHKSQSSDISEAGETLRQVQPELICGSETNSHLENKDLEERSCRFIHEKPCSLTELLAADKASGTPSPETISCIKAFCEKALALRIPLHHPSFHKIMKSLMSLSDMCKEANVLDVECFLRELNTISDAIALEFFLNTEDSHELLNLLLSYELFKPGNIEVLLKEGSGKLETVLENLPFPLLQKLYGTSLEDSIKNMKPNEAMDFVDRKDPRCLKYWLSHQENPDQALMDVFEQPIYMYEIVQPELLHKLVRSFLPTMGNFLKEKVRNSQHPEPENLRFMLDHLAEAFRSDDKVVHELLNGFFGGITKEQKEAWMCFVFQSGKLPLLKFCQDYPLDMSCLCHWRDDQGRTVLHAANMRQWDFTKESSDFLDQLLKTKSFYNLLNEKDRKGFNPLASFLTGKVFYRSVTENPVISTLLKITPKRDDYHKIFSDSRYFPLTPDGVAGWIQAACHGVASLKGFIPWLINIDKYRSSGSKPLQLQSFFEQQMSLTTVQGQRQLLKILKEAGYLSWFIDGARNGVSLEARKELLTNPFSPDNDPVWNSEVHPMATRKKPFGSVFSKKLPWTDVLEKISECYNPPENHRLLDEWKEQLNRIPAIHKVPDYVIPVPPSEQLEDSGIYGRSCYFQSTDNPRVTRLKFRKNESGKPESWQELAGEHYKLEFLRRLQKNQVLPLQTRFPEPEGLSRIRDFKGWLARAPLNEKEKQQLLDQVYIEEDGSVLTYAYSTDKTEIYHRYLYDTEGEGLSLQRSLDALQTTGFDMGLLASQGLFVELIPLYHDKTSDRMYVVLAQLNPYPGNSCDCPGTLENFIDVTNFVNSSPGVGLRDYAGISSLRDMPTVMEHPVKSTPGNQRVFAMEQIGRGFLSLVLSLARTMEEVLDPNNEDVIQKVKKNIDQLAGNYFGNAYGLSADEIIEQLNQHKITDKLARELTFWCDRSPAPAFVKHIREGTLPENIYPETYKEPYSDQFAEVITDRGFMVDKNPRDDIQLGHPNGMLPLVQLNKLITFVQAMYVHETGG